MSDTFLFEVSANVSQLGLSNIIKEVQLSYGLGEAGEQLLLEFMSENFSEALYYAIRSKCKASDIISYYDWITNIESICYNNIDLTSVFTPGYYPVPLVEVLHNLSGKKLDTKFLTQLSDICPESYVRKGKYELLFCLLSKDCKFSEGNGDICYKSMPIEIKAGVHPIFSLKYQLKTALTAAIKDSGIDYNLETINHTLYNKNKALTRNLFKNLQIHLGKEYDYNTLNRSLQIAFSYSLTGSNTENWFEDVVFVSKDSVLSENQEAFDNFVFNYCTHAIYLNAQNYMRLFIIAEDNKSFYCIKTDCKSYQDFKETNYESLSRIQYRLPAITKGARQAAMGIELYT